MWFVLSLIALLCWSGSDMFSKIGSKPSDKLSHWKMVMAVGLIMGLHACYEIFVGGVKISLSVIIAYLPVSVLYILSMVLGYVGLRYIELSVSSPICNSSGGIAAVLCFLFLQEMPNTIQWIGVAAVTIGVVLLGVAELTESDYAHQMRQQNSKVKYEKSFIALLFPLLYCIIDALGTFFDSVILREEATGTFLDKVFPTVLEEGSANVAYELTFLLVGIVAAVYVLVIRKDRLTLKAEGPKLLGGVFETAGQFAYIYALGDTAHAGFAAAIIASYCALSVLWSRIFLKEKLSWKHYAAIALTVAGIVTLGIFDA
ncbi:MAG: EamA family transporter [Clostridia bacterium]|nr:EamA family transporter [Clostridia bacterium]